MTEFSGQLYVETEVTDDTAIVHAAGEVDMSSAGLLADELAKATETSGRIVVDLDGVSFLGTSGLSVLVDANVRCQATGAALRVVPSQPARRAIEVTGLDKELQLFPTVAAAVGADSP